MPLKSSLKTLLERSDTWIGNDHSSYIERIPTANKVLDEFLLGGWPTSSLTELIVKKEGLGEISLFVETVKKYTNTNHLSIWLNPPYEPYPPALSNAGISLNDLLVVRTNKPDEWLWVAEQTIRNNALLLLWNRDKNINYRMLRKLQLAASETCLPVFLFNTPEAANDSSPAFLRIIIDSSKENALLLTLKKLRGKNPGKQLIIPSNIKMEHRIKINKMSINNHQSHYSNFNLNLNKSKPIQEIYN